MKRKLLTIILSCIMVLNLLPATVLTTAASPADITTISSAEDLKAFANSVNSGNTYEGKTVILNDNIALSEEWIPIGTGTRSGNAYTGNAFKGIFDGGNHEISGLTITTTSGADYALGLFGVVDGGTVKKLKLTDVNIKVAGSELAGGAIGILTGGGTADNITVSGSVSAKRGNGGIVGRMLVSGTISNCTNNAAMSATGANVGGIVGAAYYTAEGKDMYITNCTNNGSINSTYYGAGGIVGLSSAHVSGCTNTVQVNGAGSSVGGIVGEQQNYGSITDCSNTGTVDNTGASNCYGTGGIVGWIRYTGSTDNYPRKDVISVTGNNNSGSVKGPCDAGGIIGVVYNAATVTGNTNTASMLNAPNFAAGIVANIQFTETAVQGTSSDSKSIPQEQVDVTNNISTTSLDNMTASCKGLYVYDNSSGEQNGETADNSDAWIAQIGATNYATLQGAIDVAEAGDTIALLDDVVLSESIVIAKGENITLDLAGYTISGTDNTSKNYGLIYNNGTLTINDSSDAKMGAIELTATVNSGWNRYSAVISNNPGGTLVVNGGTIEHLGGTDMAYGIDSLTNGNLGAVSVTINGGTIKSTYRAIRQFLNSTTDANVLTVSGGTIKGAENGTAVFFHDPSAKANLGEINISEDAVINGNVYLFVTAGSTEWPVSVSIAASALSEGSAVTTKNVPATYELAESNGTYSVETVYVAQIGTTKYTSFSEAVTTAQPGDTVVLLRNIELTETVTAVAGQNITLDLNGNIISGTCAASQAHLFMVAYGADLTIIDSSAGKTGKITYAGDSSTGWIIDVEGDLILESGTLELTGTWGIGYAVDVRPNAWGTAYTETTTFTMNGGKIISSDGGVRVASSSADTYSDVSASFIMNGGEIDAAWDGVFIQQSNAVWDTLSFAINNGSIKSALNPIRLYGPTATSYVADEDCMTVALNGGTLTYTGTEAQTWLVDGIIRTGGGATAEDFMDDTAVTATSGFASANVAEGYAWAEVDNVYVLTIAASVGKVTYTDGVDGEQLFADQVYIQVLGDYTHSFTETASDVELDENGNPARPGYTFAGWNPSVATTVTEDVTYTAQWTANTYSVTLETNRGTINAGNVTTYTYGIGVPLPTNVTRSGYHFGGWYDNAECQGTAITEISATEIGDKTFYAKWNMISYDIEIADGIANGDLTTSHKTATSGTKVTIDVVPDAGYEISNVYVTTKAGKEITLITHGDGEYSFMMPASDVIVYASFKKIEIPVVPDLPCDGGDDCSSKIFTDVDQTQWYHEAIDYVIENGLMNGVGGNLFDVNGTTTRAMIVTLLWRLEGEPVVNYLMSFEDVAADEWYTEAIRWAASEGIVNGYGNGKFGTNDAITREQLATILYRYAQYKGEDISVNTTILDYADADTVNLWAFDAMLWATENGIIEGKDNNILDPLGNAKRCEAAALLMRYIEMED